MPIGDSARRASLLTREQVQIGAKFLVGRGGSPSLEWLMEIWRIEVLSFTASCDAAPAVPSAFQGFGPVLSDPIEVRRRRHGA